MSTEDEVRKLKKELSFWERVHEHEPMDEREFRLASKIRQLQNMDEFGAPRYNGSIKYDEYDYDYVPSMPYCKYCGKAGLSWIKIDSKWRLKDSNGLHVCDSYKNKKK